MTSRAEELAEWCEKNSSGAYRKSAEAAAELRRLAAIEAAACNLMKVKGRYHTEQAFKALAATLENPHG